MLPVENNIPIPVKEKATRPDNRLGGKYGFRRLEVGQSIFFPGAVIQGREYDAAKHFALRNKVRMKCVEMGDGLRVWRVE